MRKRCMQLRPNTVILELVGTGLVQMPTATGNFDELLPGCSYEIFGSALETVATTSGVNGSPMRGAQLPVPLRTMPRTEKIKVYVGHWTGGYGRPTGSDKFYVQVQPPINVGKVTEAARALNPDKSDWLLYSGDGCAIPDCSVTQDSSYWTNASRKVYFMAPKVALEPPSRRRRLSTQQTGEETATKEIMEMLTAVKADVAEVKDRLLDKDVKISPDLGAIVRRTFKCLICLSTPLNSPPGYQECCRSIVGCYQCLEAYYTAGRSQMSCPKCRAERGYTKLHEVLGMEEFLLGLQHLQDANEGVVGDRV